MLGRNAPIDGRYAKHLLRSEEAAAFEKLGHGIDLILVPAFGKREHLIQEVAKPIGLLRDAHMPRFMRRFVKLNKIFADYT